LSGSPFFFFSSLSRFFFSFFLLFFLYNTGKKALSNPKHSNFFFLFFFFFFFPKGNTFRKEEERNNDKHKDTHTQQSIGRVWNFRKAVSSMASQCTIDVVRLIGCKEGTNVSIQNTKAFKRKKVGGGRSPPGMTVSAARTKKAVERVLSPT